MQQQQQGQEWRPVAYASQAMTETERHYTQIEKEALAVTWACDKFQSYLLGLNFTIETDHKPLVPLLSMKSLNALPPHIIRFCLHLSSFTQSVVHVPGKLLYTADTLSRAPLDSLIDSVEEGVEDLGYAVVAALPASPHTLDVYRKAQSRDPICQQLAEFCHTGWPKHWDSSLGPFGKSDPSSHGVTISCSSTAGLWCPSLSSKKLLISSTRDTRGLNTACSEPSLQFGGQASHTR